MARGVLSILFVGCAWVVPSWVCAQDRVQARLVWDAPGCLSADELRARVEAQLERPVFTEPAVAVLTGAVLPAGGELEVSLTLATVEGALLGRRTLHVDGADCRALDEELVVVLALLVDLPEEEIRLALPPPASPVTFAISLAGQGALDVLPGVSGSISLAGEVWPLPVLSIALGLSVGPPLRAENEEIGVTLVTATLRPSLCVEGSLDVLRLGGCAAVDVGVISATSDGLDPDRSALRPWIIASVGPRVGLRFGPLALRLGGGLIIPLLRDRFVYGEPPALLHRAAEVAPFVELAAAYHFGS